MVLDLRATADVAFPAFDPVNETKWDPDWKPRLLAEEVREGLVFLVGDGDSTSTWILDRYEPTSRTIGYLVVAKSIVTRIRIEVIPQGDVSRATVAYTRTALDQRGIEAVERFALHFPSQAPHWEAAINGFLSSNQ